MRSRSLSELLYMPLPSPPRRQLTYDLFIQVLAHIGLPLNMAHTQVISRPKQVGQLVKLQLMSANLDTL